MAEYIYEDEGRSTADAATGTRIEWNIINLPRKITTSDGILSEYTYLADGTKVKVSSSAQGALHYLGSMVFKSATPNGTPAFESLAFSDGRIVAKEDGTLEARYHITDHLGSVRTVVRKGNTVVAEHDYYPFGQRISTGSGQTMTTALRHTFSGKEDQEHTPARAPYLDFGARLYSADAGRWLSQDPLAEKYFSLSPYAYCAGNPINMVDPEGKRIIFVNGYLGFGSPSGGANYWGGENSGFVYSAKKALSDKNVLYLDIDHKWYSSAKKRQELGYDYALENIEGLTSQMKDGESFKFVTHSMGAAFAEGMANYLIENGYKVVMMFHFAPFQANKICSIGKDSDILTIDFQTSGDPVLLLGGTGSIKDADYKVRDSSDSSLLYRHRDSINHAESWNQILMYIASFLHN